MRLERRRTALGLAALVLIGVGCSSDADNNGVQETQSRLDSVKANDVVRCGTRSDLPGFASLDPDGRHVGFDVDFCRVVAAAVLGDASKVEMIDIDAADRLPALASGEIDVLIRDTTWTGGRDGAGAATFLTTTFYDGQGMMVRSDSGFTTINDLDNVTICVTRGTTTEENLSAEATRLDLAWTINSFEDNDLIGQAFTEGECDAVSSDRSQLAGLSTSFEGGPQAWKLLPDVLSKEPLGPLVADGDSTWAQAVDWAVLATIQAEEFGIDSTNVDSFSNTDDVDIRRFLGFEVADGSGASAVFDPGLGLPTDFARQVVAQVGNYAEIFQAHLAPIGLERGLNALWSDGGLLYSPPYR